MATRTGQIKLFQQMWNPVMKTCLELGDSLKWNSQQQFLNWHSAGCLQVRRAASTTTVKHLSVLPAGHHLDFRKSLWFWHIKKKKKNTLLNTFLQIFIFSQEHLQFKTKIRLHPSQQERNSQEVSEHEDVTCSSAEYLLTPKWTQLQ